MNIITHNPFRVLGLMGNSSEKELQKQISTIKAFARVGKSKSFDYDFNFVGELSRNIENIQQAASQIEQAHKKLHYSLFWFISHSPIDEVALNHMNQNAKKSIEIWNKSLKDEITNANFNSYQNFSTLALIYTFKNDQININTLERAIIVKGKLINSEYLQSFSELVTGNRILTNSTEISKNFVNEIIELLKPYLDKSNGITTNELISLFDSFPKDTQKYLSGKFTEVPLSKIENKIEKTCKKRNENPRDAGEYGEEICKATKSDIYTLKKLLGENNVQFQMISNKLANEILQCSIDFFNKHRDEDEGFDPGDYALRIAEYAKSIGANGQIKDRINENIETIQHWVDDKPERERQEAISYEVEFITKQLVMFENQQDSMSNVENLLSKCKPQLRIIKNKLGKYDEFYINISSAVVQNAQNMLVASVNSATTDSSRKQKLTINIIFKPTTPLDRLFEEALKLTFSLGYFDMNSVLREHYNNNLQGIKSLARSLSISTISPEDRIRSEIQNLESELSSIKSKTYYANEMHALRNELSEINQWQMFRSEETKKSQVREQQGKIDRLNTKREAVKKQEISRLEEQIIIKKRELKELVQ